jgi:hypothetical protein
MTEPRKKRFPQKKPVEELTDDEVLGRIFPKKVREELHRVARENVKGKNGHNSKPPKD